ncbi:hypothetical protein DL95DRAFT_392909 [Leptodontidium sp. 2 PMI_412]|nr:hypothetical protein DL95DRAFT_392909 [Leptodontidium sp. 2 PMI_412]
MSRSSKLFQMVDGRLKRAPDPLRLTPQVQHRHPPSEIISVYRGLLRAASYLPDSAARTYACERIKSRFRASREKSGKKPRWNTVEAEEKKEPRDFTIQRLRKARVTRNLLEKAGNGDLEALKKVLLATYGREGERKRWLLKDLLRPDEEALPKNASELQQLIDNPGGAKSEKFVLDPKVFYFIRSQQEHQPVEVHKDKIRHLKAKIPEENIWGRPMPLKLKSSIQKKWWADVLEKILPPIPRSEWERLRDLATGVIPLEAQPARRTPVQPNGWSEEKTKEPLQLLQALLKPAEFHGLDLDNPPKVLAVTKKEGSRAKEKSLKADQDKAQKLTQLDQLNPPITSTAVEDPEIRNRSLRRLYASIWSMTPTMIYDEVSKKWSVEWGGQKSRAMEGAVSKPTLAEEELFEGLDTILRKLSNEKPSKGQKKGDAKRSRGDERSDRPMEEEKLVEGNGVANSS